MKKQFKIAKIIVVVILLLPLFLCWLPCEWFNSVVPDSFLKTADGSYYWESKSNSEAKTESNIVETVIPEIKESAETKAAEVQSVTKAKLDEAKKIVNTEIESKTSEVKAVVSNVENSVSEKVETVKTEVEAVAESKIDEAKTAVSEKVESVKAETEKAASVVEEKTAEVKEAVKSEADKISDTAEKAAAAVENAAAALEIPSPANAPEATASKHFFLKDLFESFKELSITLITTMIFAMLLSYILGYVSVLSMKAGRGFSNVLSAIESVPSILIALFCYAPVSGALAKSSGTTSAWLSLFVFVAAATATVLPEAVRSISIPLSDLYNRKYSVSFRSYGFTKNRILSVLMKTSLMKDTLKRVAAGILLKTLVLDTSFGFVIQVGLGSTGTPQHTSPGALIAANRKTLMAFEMDDPLKFWIPSIILIAISVAFLIVLNDNKEEA